MKIQRKEHLTEDGLQAIVNLRATLNWGLTSVLMKAFPLTTPIPRPQLEGNQKVPHPEWVAGFASGECCFMIKVLKSPNFKIGFQVQICFQLTQHNRDYLLMKRIMEYLDSDGNLNRSKEVVEYRIYKYSDLRDKIIPFFEKHPVRGVKHLDYLDWVRVVELITKKAHLTVDGLDEIRQIKAGMNKGRS